MAPILEDQVPATQFTHEEIKEPPKTDDQVPEAHKMQAVAPDAEDQVPLLQFTQTI